jgi:hypothetical protein
LEGLQNHSENHYQNWSLHHSPLVMVFELSVFFASCQILISVV